MFKSLCFKFTFFLNYFAVSEETVSTTILSPCEFCRQHLSILTKKYQNFKVSNQFHIRMFLTNILKMKASEIYSENSQGAREDDNKRSAGTCLSLTIIVLVWRITTVGPADIVTHTFYIM